MLQLLRNTKKMPQKKESSSDYLRGIFHDGRRVGCFTHSPLKSEIMYRDEMVYVATLMMDESFKEGPSGSISLGDIDEDDLIVNSWINYLLFRGDREEREEALEDMLDQMERCLIKTYYKRIEHELMEIAAEENNESSLDWFERECI